MYDIIVIGAGVVGTCIARELSKYQADVCVIDKADDVASGTSKANSGIVHAGYDCKPGTLMAKLNVRGNELLYQLAEELDFPIKKNGSLIVCTIESERGKLDVLLDQANKNGVPDARIVERDELLKMEPNLSPNAVAALYVPTGGIICPFNLAIAMGENAAVNGVEFKFETKVENIVKKDGYYELDTNKGPLEAKIVVNAAGVYADVMHNMVSEKKMKIVARKGEYLLMDKELGNYFHATIFPLPGPMGKGVLTAPTIHGNMFVGPSATDIEDKEGVNTTQEIIDDLVDKASNSYLTKDRLPMNKVITSFAGLRAHEEHHEFIVEEVADAPGFFDAAGIESPGLTSSPAIAEMMVGLIEDKYNFPKKDNFIAKRKGIVHMEDLSIEEKNEMIKKNPQYGNIVCRCEMVTEGEIVDAINRPLGARSLDAIKRRTRQGMGRCQAGFCTPRTMEILSRELGIPMTEITKKGEGSNMLVGKIKED
ncbi:MAG: NAD(P)/FAD-dependent oxidoreductase [Clostridiales bacterium]|nr:NAD(P)/FAD-dependent oxidoreductase [Clostridiales bacterium]